MERISVMAENKRKKKRKLDPSTLSLDRGKVDRLMASSGYNKVGLAAALGWSRQLLYYHLSRRTVKGAEAIGGLFGIAPKRLLLEVKREKRRK
jgi:hypothetical protein